MDLEWRQENDWIHRNAENELLAPLEAIKYCSKRNIREKFSSSAEAVEAHFRSRNALDLEQMKTVQPQADTLKKVARALYSI